MILKKRTLSSKIENCYTGTTLLRKLHENCYTGTTYERTLHENCYTGTTYERIRPRLAVHMIIAFLPCFHIDEYIYQGKTPLTMELLVIESVISGWKADISVVTRLCRGCVQICSFDTIFICNQTGIYVKYAWKMQSFKLLNLLKQTKRIICDRAIIVLLYQLLWWNIDIDLALM